MSARGLLANPVRIFFTLIFYAPCQPSISIQALFAGYDHTPMHAVSVRHLTLLATNLSTSNSSLLLQNFITLSTEYTLPFPLVHRHLAFMLESQFSKPERVYFNSLTSFASVYDHLEERGVAFDNADSARLFDNGERV